MVLFSRPVSLYPPENLMTFAYALLFARAALAWHRHRAAFDAALGSAFGSAGPILFYWHVVPVAISFLLPKRLASFLWFVGPANVDPQLAYDPIGGALLYWRAFVEGFHVAPWVAVLAVVLAMIGMFGMWRTPLARGVIVFAAWSMIAVIAHPQHQGRFLASWVFAVWICAGAGAGVLFEARASPAARTSFKSRAWWRSSRRWPRPMSGASRPKPPMPPPSTRPRDRPTSTSCAPISRISVARARSWSPPRSA